MKEFSLGTVGKTIVGLIGAGVGQQILSAMGMLPGRGGGLVGDIGGLAVGGAILIAIGGAIKNALAAAKSQSIRIPSLDHPAACREFCSVATSMNLAITVRRD